MLNAIIGRKVGMTRFFTESGENVPVTVIQAGPCVVTQVKTDETDGYNAVQLGFNEVKPRRSTMPVIGHDHRANSGPLGVHREFRVDDAGLDLGDRIDVSCLEDTKFVDVTGTSKGKGFAGVMKRYHFRGLEASHGVKRKHRHAGSIGGHSANLGTGPKIKKGKRMCGHMGHERVTVRSLEVISIDADKNLILVKGPIPGPADGIVMVRCATRLYKTKARVAKAG
jgi:large subunit ribosomal protein L3